MNNMNTQTTKKPTNKKKMALGKGIASLLKSNSTDVLLRGAAGALTSASKGLQEENRSTTMLNINSIRAGEYQPRKIFKDKDLVELSQSIKENGIIQPLIVFEKDGKLELIAGERRLRAAKMAGLEQVPVVFKRGTDRERLIMSVIENVQRSDLNCVEEALAYYQLMDSFKLTQDEVAKKIGKERSTVANFLRILKLPRQVVALLQKELLSFGHAKILASEKDPDRTLRLANIAVSEKLSVRELEKQIKKRNKVAVEANKSNKFFDERISQCKDHLEKKTGFHFQLKSKKSGSGDIVIKFNNEAEFNDIYEYLLKK